MQVQLSFNDSILNWNTMLSKMCNDFFNLIFISCFYRLLSEEEIMASWHLILFFLFFF